jgi:predicted permease
MSTLGEILTNIIGPILLVVGVALIADRKLKLDTQALSRLLVYVFTPFLIFRGVAHSDLSGDEVGQLVAVAALMSAGVALTAWWVARQARFDRQLASAFTLSATLINAGNYGLPLNRFAFGAAGEERALVFFITTVVVSYTLGVFLASFGRLSARGALRNVFMVPLPYAAALGLAVNVGDVALPLPVQRAIGLLADATIPVMLVVLGAQLSRASVRGRIQPILLASGLRLLLGPLIAVGLAALLGLSGLTRQVAIVQAAMPTAVVTGVLAAEFGSDAQFVTATILVSTVASVATLTILLALLM